MTDLDVPVQDVPVMAVPIDEGTLEPYQTVTATTTTDVAGIFGLTYLVPGTYTVSIDPGEGYTSIPLSADVAVTAGSDVVDVDFLIVAE